MLPVVSHYELIDFGFGQKLERFGSVKVLRDCPAAQNVRPTTRLNQDESELILYSRTDKTWSKKNSLPSTWAVQIEGLCFELKLTPYGHLGIFPEQASNWQWVEQLDIDLAGKRVLNLFAYTGGTTMAFAKRGAIVTHVDSAKNVVRWASQNAAASGLKDAKIRWIVEDAQKFVCRELKRGNYYDIVVADPPAIGHAGQKMTWKIERDIQTLIAGLNDLTEGNVLAILLSCHSEGFTHDSLKELTKNAFGELENGAVECNSMDLICSDGRRLNCGHFFRWQKYEN